MSAEKRLAELGIELPGSSPAKAMYIPVKRLGDALYISGQIPMVDGAMLHPGHVGAELTLEQGQEAARACIINMLSAVRAELGTLDEVKNVVKLVALVSSAPDFTEQHLVANAASELLYEVFGEAGRHARSAFGVAALPLGAPVEIEAVFEL